MGLAPADFEDYKSTEVVSLGSKRLQRELGRDVADNDAKRGEFVKKSKAWACKAM